MSALSQERTLGAANQNVFADTLLEMARQDENIVVVTSDSRGSGKLVPFGEALPDQIIEVGIAEQNLVGIAAGLASAGKKVFAISPACFLTARALEQIKNDVCYSDNPVRVIGISAGVSYGALGSTHHSLHDYAALRAINNIDIFAPADNAETRAMVEMLAGNYPRPAYVRLGKKPMLNLYPADNAPNITHANTLSTGIDVSFLSIGEPTGRALLAADKLNAEGIRAGCISLPSLRPFDAEAVLAVARQSRALVTVEEHSIYGGLGEKIASLLMQNRISLPFKVIGIPDEYTVTGSQFEIFDHYGISAEGLADTARQLLGVEVSA